MHQYRLVARRPIRSGTLVHGVQDALYIPSGMQGLGKVPTTGMGQSQAERGVVLELIVSGGRVYKDLAGTLEQLSTALDSFDGAWSKYKAALAKTAMQGFMRYGGLFSPVSASFGAVIAVVETVKKAKDAGIDFNASKEAFKAIADTLKHTDMALSAYKDISVGDLVGEGLVPEAGLAALARRIGYAGDIKEAKLGTVTEYWAKYAGEDTEVIFQTGKLYNTYYRIVAMKLHTLGEKVGLKEDEAYTLTDFPLRDALKKKLLEEMKKAHEEVLERQKPAGWLAETFNTLVAVITDALLLAFGIGGAVFGVYMSPAISMNAGLSRASYAAGRLIDAAASISAAGIATYTAAFKVARVDEKKSEAVANAEATVAMEKTIEKVGKEEYETAYKEIENYRNYAKQLQEIMAEFGFRLLDLGKYLLYAGIIVGGAIVVTKVL